MQKVRSQKLEIVLQEGPLWERVVEARDRQGPMVEGVDDKTRAKTALTMTVADCQSVS